MRRTVPRVLLGLTSSLLLFGCGSGPQPDAGDGAVPWTDTAPATLRPQALTPGTNTLQYERVLSATNGYGPVEKNRSNGERAAGDGKPLTLNGRVYPQGYGVHAGSELVFSLKGTDGTQCTRFTVNVGVDDEVGDRGSVVFQVLLDGLKVYDSGRMTGVDVYRTVDLNVRGKGELRLVVTDAGDGISHDHADWAGPRLDCEAPRSSTGQPGTLDLGFGQYGALTLHPFHFGTSSARSLVEPGGAILSAFSRQGQFVLQRTTPDGRQQQVATSFGSAVPDGFTARLPTALALQGDGKIVLAGTYGGQLALARFGRDLSLDTSFGRGGQVLTQLGEADPGTPAFSSARAVLVQADGKIVVAGTASRHYLPEVDNTSWAFVATRYTPGGTLDTGFGAGGTVNVQFDDLVQDGYTDDVVNDLVLLGDGRILLVGQSSASGTNAGSLVRLTPGGQLDVSFGTRGRVFTRLNYGALHAAQPEPNGNVVAVGWTGRNRAQALVLRYSPGGALLASKAFVFRPAGNITVNSVDDLTVQSDGKIVVGGLRRSFDGGTQSNFALARLNTDLSLDASFGTEGTGLVVLEVPGEIHDLMRQADGKIVALGENAVRLWP